MQLSAITKSSTIASIDYDTDSEILTVGFVKGGKYEYLHVPFETFERFSKAESQGSFHAREIKGHFEYRKVEVAIPDRDAIANALVSRIGGGLH